EVMDNKVYTDINIMIYFNNPFKSLGIIFVSIILPIKNGPTKLNEDEHIIMSMTMMSCTRFSSIKCQIFNKVPLVSRALFFFLVLFLDISSGVITVSCPYGFLMPIMYSPHFLGC